MDGVSTLIYYSIFLKFYSCPLNPTCKHPTLLATMLYPKFLLIEIWVSLFRFRLRTPPPTHNIKGLSYVRLITTFLFNKHNCYIQETSIISLVRSQLMSCSTLWKPYLLKDIRQLEQIQRRTMKYILNDYTSNYKSRLLELKICL